MAERSPQHRNVCFTVNANYPQALRLLDMTHTTWQHVKFCVYQRECADHEHFQGYMEFTQPKTYDAMHLLEGMEGAHFEKRRGTQKQAIHYCIKPVKDCECNICTEELRAPTYLEGPWTFGEPNHQGARADLLEIQRDIRAGHSNKRIAEDHFPEWVRFGKAFKEYKRIIAKPRDFKSTVILLVGPSGTGKSRFAHLLCRYLGGSHYKVPDKQTGFWCDDYDGDNVFFMDEFDGDRMRPKAFNDLCDRYECVVPAHGNAGHQIVAKYIVICSNYLPKFWWKTHRKPAQLKQIMRRIDVIIPFWVRPPAFEHTGFQEFGPNTNRPAKDKEELYE